MTNWDAWQLYMSGIASPQPYIDWGVRYLIAASLQRRVWCPPDHAPVYPNIYPIMVGKAGLGKGNVIRFINEILRYHKLKDNLPSKDLSTEEQVIANTVLQKDLESFKENNKPSSNNIASDALLIPMGPNSTTYEALTRALATSIRRTNCQAWDEKLQRNVLKISTHCSIAFCLEELGSLLHKNTDNIINLIQECYDCRPDYVYETKNNGTDRVKNPCLNFFAGCTPDYIETIFQNRLLNQGISSRAFFIFADKPRAYNFFIPELTEEQKLGYTQLVAHVKRLASLHGKVVIEPDIMAYLQEWYVKYNETPGMKASNSPRMEHYYARKNIHVMKVAMGKHFLESTEMFLSREDVDYAIAVLHEEEKTMHLALNGVGENKLSKLGKRIEKMLRDRPITYTEILIDTNDDATEKELCETLDTMKNMNLVSSFEKQDEHTGQNVVYWKLMK